MAEDDRYNYSHFTTEDFPDFKTVLTVGWPAPDFSVTVLETGEQVEISRYWQERDVLLEFGSVT